MSDGRGERLRALFGSALDLAPRLRPDYLRAECAGQTSLLRDVLELLAQHEAAAVEGFLAPLSDGPLAPEPDEEPGLPPGMVVDDYEIVDLVGRGGMGVVYLARQRTLNRLVALKVIRDGALATAGQRARFRIEAEAIARCQHPQIVQVFACGEHEGRPFLVLEFAPGGSLARMLGRMPQPPRGAAALVRSLALAVESAHRCGVVHRDLKPANILLTGEGLPKVGDFGLAKPIEGAPGQTDSGELLGPPSYKAPEQVGGRSRDVGPGADVYALGAILYEALTGRPPFTGATKLEILDQVRAADPVPSRRLVPGVPRDLETICLHCLRKEPGRRYAAAADLAEDLRRLLAGEPIRARPVGPPERAWKWARRHPTAASLAAVEVLAMLAATAAGLRFERRVRETEAAMTARALVGHLGEMRTTRVPDLLPQLAPYRRWANPVLRDTLAKAPPGSPQHLHASLTLLPVDPGQVGGLYARLLALEPEDVIVLRTALAPHRAALAPRLWNLLDSEVASPGERLRAACALAEYDPHDRRWPDLAREVVRHLERENPLLLHHWARAMRPVRTALLPHLAESVEAGPPVAVDLRTVANPYKMFSDESPEGFERLERRLADAGEPGATEASRVALARRQADVAVALLIMGRGDAVWPLLRHTPDPTVRSALIERLHADGVDPAVLVARRGREPDASARRAILLALGEYDPDHSVIPGMESLTDALLSLYRNEPDAGLHGALNWLLGRRGQARRVRRIDREMEEVPPGDRGWLVNRQGQVFSIATIPADLRAGARGEPARPPGSHRFMIAVKEVTGYQLRRISTRARRIAWDDPFAPSCPEPDGPALGVLWQEAAAYCNWLSRQEHIPADQWCYIPAEAEATGVPLRPAPDLLERTGYRLPTFEEWDHACRAAASTPYAFGRDQDLLGRYGWWFGNADGHALAVGRLKPNDLGLFDMYGNYFEHCEPPGAIPPHGLAGGSYLVPSIAVSLFDRNIYPEAVRGQSVGFRPARTLRAETVATPPEGSRENR